MFLRYTIVHGVLYAYGNYAANFPDDARMRSGVMETDGSAA